MDAISKVKIHLGKLEVHNRRTGLELGRLVCAQHGAALASAGVERLLVLDGKGVIARRNNPFPAEFKIEFVGGQPKAVLKIIGKLASVAEEEGVICHRPADSSVLKVHGKRPFVRFHMTADA